MTARDRHRATLEPDRGGSTQPGHGQVWLAQTFVELADTLADGFDVLEHLQLLADRAAGYTAATAAGVLLTDQRGGLQVAATTGHVAERLELFEAQTHQGPCAHTVDTAEPVLCRDLVEHAARWPQFTTRATALGVHAVTALPLRVRDQILGAIGLFHPATGGVGSAARQVVQAFADVAAISVLTHRAAQEGDELTRQLQTAVNNRVLVEQAKGMIAQYAGISTHAALGVLRGHARSHNVRLSDLAADILDDRTRIADLTHPDQRLRPGQ